MDPRALVLALGLVGCASEIPGADYGADLFGSTVLSPSSLNPFSCATCHETSADAPLVGGSAGYGLYGVANRGSYWGGDRLALRDAVDACLIFFMKGKALDIESEQARGLYDHLLAISPPEAPREALAFSVVENVADVARGDAGRGEEVYGAACLVCHGEAFTAMGSILRKEINLPGVTADYADLFPGVDASLVVIEKVRHGRFFNIGGEMAPFSRETLTDDDLGALLQYLDL